ncbi:MAG: secondary thiamine-phosphate synthase enzyme YjbQ [Methanobacterium sp. ERen5]|nr:MAG: secondary thiamine-phosphate synthase enzyme YjbQ [Methanobacterium sp. ERen5]
MYKRVFEVKTSDRLEIVDISSEINSIVAGSGVKTGLVNLFSQHSTSGIVINENESGLVEDFKNLLKKIVQDEAGYKHDRIDNNADSHLRSLLLGNSVNVPVENGRMELGTWQSIFFIELDGPRTRNITVTVLH